MKVPLEFLLATQTLLEQYKVLSADAQQMSKIIRSVSRFLSPMHVQSLFSQRLLQDLMGIAQIKSNTFDLKNEFFDLTKTVTSTFKLIQCLAEERKVNLRGPLFEHEGDRIFFKRFYGDSSRYS